VKRIMAIDPGASGGIAWVNADGITQAVSMPKTEGDIIEFMRSHSVNIEEAYIEDVGKGVMPGRAIAMISLNINATVIRTALACFGVRVVMVRPQDWQATYSLGKRRDCASDTIWKNKLKSEAQRRYPTLEVTNMTADALLILDFAKECF
jgi:hypothetical protein